MEICKHPCRQGTCRGRGGRFRLQMNIGTGVNRHCLAAHKPGGQLPVIREIETALLGKNLAALG